MESLSYIEEARSLKVKEVTNYFGNMGIIAQ